ncbi:MAG: RNA polymerase sigma factor, partial [Pseudomonadota bacterium]
MHMQNDDTRLQNLIDRVAEGDEYALKHLYELTSAKLYGLALRIMGQRDRAEDVLQETFLQVWRTAADYRATLSPPLAWLGLIVRSRALDQLRRQKVAREHLTEALDETVANALGSDADDPLDANLASQQARALHRCLARLERRQRAVVTLAYLRDLSHVEVAEQLQLPLGTVKTWIRRGR